MSEPSRPSPSGGEAAPNLTPLQRAFLALEQTRAQLRAAQDAAREPIAIIGLGCRMPGGVDSPAAFWRLLEAGVDAVREVPADRWDRDALFDANPDAVGRITTRSGGFLDRVDAFDPAVFGISPREAASMDPQQRVLLEVAWETLEHAGIAPDSLEGSATGVYVGVTASDYAYLQLASEDRALLDAHFTSGIAHSMHSGRLSYLLGLQGPSITIDTACSSSLVAVHLACAALRTRDCRMALAGGVNLILSPDLTVALSRARMLAPDGRCKTFSAAADGFARGEGCAMIALKRLSDARQDGDRILAVIRGSSVNQDGASSSLTAPNGPAQEAVLRDALARAGVAARDVSYVEAHGTGTELGDPIEVRALASVFGDDRDAAHPLAIGSVKTNLGHLEAAAGVAGVLKVVLALQARTIPKHLHFEAPSPHIPWADLPVVVPTAATPWPPLNGKRIAGVSAFGFSGTNAHVVIEEAPDVAAAGSGDAGRPGAWLLPLSAADEGALRDGARRLADALVDAGDDRLADVCFTEAVGRSQLSHRAVVAARTMRELRARLVAFADTGESDGVRVARLPRIDPARAVFLFTGQGAQYAGMTRGLYETVPVFRDALDRCAAALAPHLPVPLLELLWGSEQHRLDQTQFTQPALVAIEWSLAELWRHWGVEPSAVLGHSVGEYVGACLAGVMPLEDMLALVAARGRLMQSLPPGGAMTAIGAAESDVAPAVARFAKTVAIAGINAADQTVISGVAADVDAIAKEFAARGVRVRPLQVSHAFHSPLLDPMLAGFEAVVRGVTLSPPHLPVVSNVTGQVATASMLTDASYWRQQARQAVRFADGVGALAALRPELCIELGPTPALLAPAEAAFASSATTLVATLRKGRDDWEQVLDAVGAAWLRGAPIDWKAIYAPYRPSRIALPTYAWRHERHWFAATPTEQVRPAVPAGRATSHPLLGARLRSAANDAVFESIVSPSTPAWVSAHRVQGLAIMPGTAYLETMRAAAALALRSPSVTLSDVVVREALVVDGPRAFQVVVGESGDARTVRCFSLAADADEATPWSEHASATVIIGGDAPADVGSLDAARSRCTTPVLRDAFYADLARRGLDFGVELRTLQTILRGQGEAVGEVALDERTAGDTGYGIHPLLLDGCMQAVAVAMSADDEALFLPLGFGGFSLYREIGQRCWCHAVASGSGATRRADVSVFDEAGALVATLRDVRLARAAAGALARLGDRWLDDALYEVRWEDSAAAAAAPPRTAALDEALDPAKLAAAATAALPALVRETSLDRYDTLQSQLEALSALYVERALDRLGWQPAAGEQVGVESLRERLGILPRHSRLLRRMLDIGVEVGLLETRGDGWTVRRPLRVEDIAAAHARIAGAWRAHGDAPELEMTARAGDKLAEALRGDADPHHLLFPGGSTENAERMYRDISPARVMNGIVAAAVRSLADAAAPGRPLRILEIGAGTGGTTAYVAPLLPADRVSYTFSDVGPLFVARARDRFAPRFGFMRFEVLDLERDPLTQGFGAESFDLIIATNVIHATADLRRTLERVRRLLAPGGTLAMLEVTAPQRWFDLTVGLTDGWWAFTDLDLRAHYATLPRDRWVSLLGETGFADVSTTPGDAASHGATDGSLGRQAAIFARVPSAPAARGWLLWADAGGTMTALCAALRGRGDRCVLVRAGSEYTFSDMAATVRAGSSDDARRLLADCRARGIAVDGVVYGASLDGRPWEASTAADIADAEERGPIAALAIVQALLASTGTVPPLWLVTRGAEHADSADASLDPAQATMSGLALGVSLEHPELPTTCVDLDPSSNAADDVASLLAELDGRPSDRGAREVRVAHRGQARRVPRLAHVEARRTSAAQTPWRLTRDPAGSLDGLTRQPMPTDERRAPRDGEVEIAVEATGLNFKDVLNALGMYPGDPGPLGGECAGVVARVGPGVTHVKPGDRVMAIGGGSFASHVVTRASLVQPLPETMSFDEGATFPIAYLTAYFCLEHVAHVRPGDRVLVHAAAGGVGMAAVLIAQRAGAEVFATAGAPWKRDVVRALGVKHVFDSRSPAFADEILRATGGRGVDVVLNSLADEMLDASFRVLARGGRFVEIGKRGIRTAAEVAAQDPTAEYTIVDWGETEQRAPELIGGMFASLADDLRAGRLRSLPRHVFEQDEVQRAFRFMAQARHVGRIVVRHRTAASADAPLVRGDGTYLVTGGLSGLGLVVARWLGDNGAGRIVLVSRRGVTDESRETVAGLRATGIDVVAEALDVSDEAALRALMDRLRESGPPLRGVIHGAGLLDDAGLPSQTAEKYRRVLAPKVMGGYLLDRLTRPDPLDWFVAFSSIASVIGGRGQSNHSAANAFLDLLAHERRLNGRPGLSINWGAWTDTGAAVEGAAARLAEQGLGAITPAQGLRALERLLSSRSTNDVVLPADWSRLIASRGNVVPTLLSRVVERGSATRAAADGMKTAGAAKAESPSRPAGVREQLAATPPARRRAVVQTFVRERAQRALGIDPSRPADPRTPLGDLGLDSLLAVELRNTLGTALGTTLPATLLFDYPTIDALTDHLLHDVLGEPSAAAETADAPPAAAAPASTTAQAGALVNSIEALTDDEVDRLLASRAKRN
jgi:acyl transferase domain-containing protein/SAM-dependent methyltransferase